MVGGPPCQPFSKAGYWVKNENRNRIISYTNKVAKGDDKTKEYIWSLAEQYNKSLSSVKIVDSFYKEDDKLSDEYLKLLNFDSDGLRKRNRTF